MPRLIGEEIRVSFDGTEVLQSVSFRLDVGETIALMGPSGSGKSTLLAVLGGLLNPASGQVRYDQTSTKREVAWIFQSSNVLPRRSAIDNVMFGAFRRGANIDKARTLGLLALEQIGMGWSAERRVGLLSGGERQRVAVAAALVGDPPLLLADEPTAQLDYDNAHSVTQAILGLAQQTSVVIATHDPNVARCCDRVVYLENGQIRA